MCAADCTVQHVASLAPILSRVTLLIALSVSALGFMGCEAPPAVELIGPLPAGDVLDVPVTFENDLPVVEFVVEDHTLRLIVDLGGTDAVSLSASAAEQLDLRWSGRSRSVADAFGRMWRSREFVIPRAELAGLTLDGVRGYEMHDGRFNIPSAGGRPPVQLDGYIGVDLLRRFNLLVDYPNGRFRLVAHDAPPPVDTSAWATSAFEFGRPGVTSRIGLDGVSRLATWDTGANHTVIRPDRVSRSAPRRQRTTGDEMTSAELTIGGTPLGSLELVLLDFRQPSVDVILGTNLFRDHATWFDFTASRLAVEP